ncbi:MAG: methylmalonyl Co-A mutase-associated GTPase MeaB [Sphingobacteriaceae bacterium]|nr:methylmalonyl Co-A mutase-associated GTPase MeaB [Sphingobacteriaceae bacterium]
MDNLSNTLKLIASGDFRTIARALTYVENNIFPAEDLLKGLKKKKNTKVIGITGPPGAGKSTLVNSITNSLVKTGKKVAILAIDPTSPFNFGSLLGDRIRMSSQFNNPNVFIRSLATRGSLGGVSAKTIEILDVLLAADFDLIMIETVGVGQSEVEIAGIASKTIVVLVPESGDEIQNIKSGLMEIAQGFVVNKADREGADIFAANLLKITHQQSIPIFKTVADKEQGISALCNWLLAEDEQNNERKEQLLTEKAFQLIQHKRMMDIDKKKLRQKIAEALKHHTDFNMYKFVADFNSEN